MDDTVLYVRPAVVLHMQGAFLIDMSYNETQEIKRRDTFRHKVMFFLLKKTFFFQCELTLRLYYIVKQGCNQHLFLLSINLPIISSIYCLVEIRAATNDYFHRRLLC